MLDQLIARFLDAIMGHFSGKVNSYTVDNEGLHKTFVTDMGGDDSLGKRPLQPINVDRTSAVA